MANKHRNTQVNFKTDGDLWQQAKAVFADNHIDATQGFNLYLRFIAENKVVPFQEDATIRRERLISELQTRAAENLAAMDRGEYKTLAEVEKLLLG